MVSPRVIQFLIFPWRGEAKPGDIHVGATLVVALGRHQACPYGVGTVPGASTKNAWPCGLPRHHDIVVCHGVISNDFRPFGLYRLPPCEPPVFIASSQRRAGLLLFQPENIKPYHVIIRSTHDAKLAEA